MEETRSPDPHHIVLYDIPSIIPGRPWSPNTLKARYTLSFKRIPFRTVWVELPDIEKTIKALGGEPTSVVGGRSMYTLPVIKDPSTGTVISDSFKIAQYLDATYPSLPRVLPDNTAALVAAFDAAFLQTLMPVALFGVAMAADGLNPVSKAYYLATRARRFGPDFEKAFTVGNPKRDEAWKALEQVLSNVDRWYAAGSGCYLMGDSPCFADFIVAGRVKCMQYVVDEDMWGKAREWHGGRWARLIEDLDKILVV
ncbi:hypothetical protein CONPUDRAFT_135449 [Coniophora puteana RWD-64-598 SS2]|uniref:GST N-terminal domain-containing protein n=1 Tax=Coniophora puteana (strain RWD-64-598) TaxID=741705 RepID=A0A5M3MX08_CONPW|nr:uncharacterized protein CONPUDRAFT_135449 [Coniophora puteana RWD-64-598 SS2]EIW83679.1 hypothetical protein CONPUDRAFT_135449 [Coniophora puteana RWD-64-598 SS2]